MWATTLTYAFIIAFLSWVVVCWIRIWSFKPGPCLSGFIPSAVFLIISRSVRVVYAFLGMFLLDLTARVCFSGLISYGSFSNIAAPVIFCTTLGMAYILCTTFIAPTKTTLPVFVVMAGTYLYMSTMMPFPELRIALYTGLGLMLIFSVLDILMTGLKRRHAEDRPEKETSAGTVVFSPPLWDLSRKINCSEGTKVYAVVMILLSVEFVLQFEGLSLLCWL